MPDESIVFVSDLHFGDSATERERRASFRRFLASLRGISRLVIVGDLFQFWFDLGATMPKGYFDVLDGLYRLREGGTRIDYLGGNHDFWRSDFFRRELGIETHGEMLPLEVQGRRILARHGDGAGPGDRGYKLLKRAVRAPVTMGLARILHPDLLHGLAHRVGEFSRVRTERRPIDEARLERAAREAFAGGYDALVMGHVHVQLHRRLDGGELVVIGDWLDLRSYVRLESGRFVPGRWQS